MRTCARAPIARPRPRGRDGAVTVSRARTRVARCVARGVDGVALGASVAVAVARTRGRGCARGGARMRAGRDAGAADAADADDEEDEEDGEASAIVEGEEGGAEAGDEVGDEGDRALTIGQLREEVVEEEVEELTVLGRVSEGVRRAGENPGLRNLGALALFFLASTFAYSCYKVYRKATSGRSKRKRTVNKNVEVVERLKNFFPAERASVNKGVLAGLALKTGYTQAEIFRKYLRYKLTEEAFTLDFVADVLALKNACGLASKDVKSILLETGERMFKKYGTLMTNLAGLTQSGMERKIDGAGKFAKLMYLADLEEFIDKADGAEVQLKLKETFGATDEDYSKVKITALGSDEVDVSALNQMIGAVEGGEQPTGTSDDE